jgi:HD-like signal output (HDOD) protein
VDFLSQAEIPVLRSTVGELARLEKKQDNVTPREITAVILRDPMLTLRVLRYLQEFRRDSQATEITTVGHAVMMLGITPFFRRFCDMKIVEEVLAERQHALEGFMGVVNRVRHAALHAREWAALCHDIESDEVIIAALLHDVAEMLLWCLAPGSATQISDMMQQDRTLRSAAAQESVLGFRLIDLQLALVKQWHLPALLQALMDDQHASQRRTRIVALAVALARHAANGWDDAALADDYASIQRFLALSPHEAMERIRRVALMAIRGLDWHGVLQPAAWLPPLPAAWADAESDGNGESAAARPAVLKRVYELLAVRAARTQDFLEILSLVFHGMHAGIGLNRVLFMEINCEHSKATARYVAGSGEASQLRKFQLDLVCPHVFSRLIGGMQAIWYNAAARRELQPFLPEDIQEKIGQYEFFAMAVPVNGTPIGLIYADGGQGSPVLDADQYDKFTRLCMLLAESLEREPRTGRFH